MRAAIRSISKKSFRLHCHYDIYNNIVVTNFCISSLHRKRRGERRDQRSGEGEAEQEGQRTRQLGKWRRRKKTLREKMEMVMYIQNGHCDFVSFLISFTIKV